ERLYYKQALAIAKRNNRLSGEVSILCNLGSAYLSLGDYTQAISFSRQSLEKAENTEDKRCTPRSLNNIGTSLFELGKLEEAEKSLQQALKYFEETRSFLGDNDDFKISIFDEQVSAYLDLQKVLIAQNKTDEALKISERGRARAFVELLAKRLANQDNSFPATITPPNIEQIKQIAQQQNATLVEYSLIYDQGEEAELFIWVVKPTGEITFRRSNLKPLWQQENTSLAKLVTHTRIALGVQGLPLRSLNRDIVAIQPRPGFEPYKNGLNRLHQLLIDPIADLLPTDPNEKVIFIPQSSLFLTPFPALQDEQGNYLIEKHTILTAPSIQTLQLTREQKQKTTATGDALVVGNPTMPKVKDDPLEPAIQLASLPGAEKEALAIAPLLNTQPLTGNEATKSTIVKQMASANIIHLATHGLLDDVQGMGSGIALAPDSSPGNGLLTATEIYDMNLQANLVVLSACNTGRGKITGDGVIGLSRSFISAGVPSVLVSLWAVPDAPTGELMVEFYNQLEKNPDKAQALRQAMLATMKQHPEPRNWAAFTLIGESD
ncbi:MAG: CHAT domain-containing tetratricopeptide repeat protein, partial [Spirulinaceae cyanobacterium]